MNCKSKNTLRMHSVKNFIDSSALEYSHESTQFYHLCTTTYFTLCFIKHLLLVICQYVMGMISSLLSILHINRVIGDSLMAPNNACYAVMLILMSPHNRCHHFED